MNQCAVRVVSTKSRLTLRSLARASIACKQALASARAPVIRMHGETGELGHAVLVLIQRGAPDDHAIVFEHEETLDFHFQQIAAALDQRAVRLERFEQPQHAADVLDARRPQFFERILRQHGADAAARKKFEQQRAVGVARQEMRTLNARRGRR